VVNEYDNKQYYHVDAEATKNKEADTGQNIMTTFFVLFLFPNQVNVISMNIAVFFDIDHVTHG
jgi:hypothetical protein